MSNKSTINDYKDYLQDVKESTPAAMLVLADSMDNIASALRALGTNNAMTEMGAIEFLAVQIKQGMDDIATSIEGVNVSIPDTEE